MNPPTEQLIRDYLNRLSVAAQGRLSPKDRQVLLDQTRARIEVECAGLSETTIGQIRQILADLGDPVAVVEAEQTRVAARRRSATARQDAEAVAGRNGMASSASGLKVILPWVGQASSGGASSGGASSGGASSGGASSGGASSGGASPGSAFLDAPVPSAGAEPGDSPGDGSGDGPFDSPSSGDNSGPAAEHPGGLIPRPAVSPESATGQDADDGDDAEAPDAERAAVEFDGDSRPSGAGHAEFHMPAGPQDGRTKIAAWLGAATSSTASLLARVGRRLWWIAMNHKREAVAVILIGIGGAVFPPLWLPGAMIALTSRVWDIRDKWIGIVLPVLAVIVGTVFVILLGGHHNSPGSSLFDAWVGAGRLFRLMAVASGGYLLWRLRLGRRQPRQPPWNIPHKLDL